MKEMPLFLSEKIYNSYSCVLNLNFAIKIIQYPTSNFNSISAWYVRTFFSFEIYSKPYLYTLSFNPLYQIIFQQYLQRKTPNSIIKTYCYFIFFKFFYLTHTISLVSYLVPYFITISLHRHVI